MSGLVQYLELIVEPTLDDFRKNPLSVRHAYLAAVVTYHAIDRAAYPRKSRVLLEKWRKESPEFGIVELVANQLKHVKANEGPAVPGRIPISAAIFGRMAYNTTPYSHYGMDVRNIFFVVRDAIKFLHKQAGATPRKKEPID